MREGRVAGVPARVMRVGFVGELGYEIHVPAENAAHVWDALMAAGAQFAHPALRRRSPAPAALEKGHVIIGQDTDGLTTPAQASMEWAVKMDKPFFVGQRSPAHHREAAAETETGRLRSDASFAGSAPKECHLIIRDGQIAGRVTSVAHSPALGHVIGLALIAPEMAGEGTRFNIRVEAGAMVEARVVATPFYDAAGERQKVAAHAPQPEALPA